MGAEKGTKIDPKMAPKNVAKKSHPQKLHFSFFFYEFEENIDFIRQNGPRRAILLYFTVNSRVRKGGEITANVAKTLQKR